VPVLGEFIHRVSHQVLPADEKVWAQVEAGALKGLWFELNPRTGQSYLRGEAESAVLQVLTQWLRPGMVFYDLGANIGLFTLLAGRLVGAAGKVYSFEPDAEAVGRLRRNVARNGLSNVTIVDMGVWSASGEVDFVPAGSSSPDSGTGKFIASGDATGTPTRCIALDDFVRNAAPPDAIKCDVEGAEVEALRGAERLLQAHRPWILCEMHSEATDRASRELLSRLGYTFEAVDANHVLASM
jgi:FkbM family methyltransferase